MLLSTEYHIQGNNGFVLTTNVHTYICKLYAFVFVSLNFKRTKKNLTCCKFSVYAVVHLFYFATLHYPLI